MLNQEVNVGFKLLLSLKTGNTGKTTYYHVHRTIAGLQNE